MSDIQDLTAFAKLLGEYQKRAKNRLDERKSTGQLDGDFYIWTIHEMLIDVMNRLTKIEALLDLKPKE